MDAVVGFTGTISFALLLVVVLLFILPFLLAGTNRRIDLVNANIRSLNENILMNQNRILEVQKAILACLQKTSGKPDTEVRKKPEDYLR